MRIFPVIEIDIYNRNSLKSVSYKRVIRKEELLCQGIMLKQWFAKSFSK